MFLEQRDRRVVHLSLAKFEGVSTQSQGEGMQRRIQIIPSKLGGMSVVSRPSGAGGGGGGDAGRRRRRRGGRGGGGGGGGGGPREA